MDGDTGGNTPQLSRKKYHANSLIFDEGDKGDVAFLIRSGQVEIRKGSRHSNPHRLAILNKGEVLGEMALIDDGPRMAAAIALTDVELIEMKREDFKEMVSSMSPIMKGIVRAMANRLRIIADEKMYRQN